MNILNRNGKPINEIDYSKAGIVNATYGVVWKIHNDYEHIKKNELGLFLAIKMQIGLFYNKNGKLVTMITERLEKISELHLVKDEKGNYKTYRTEFGELKNVGKTKEDEAEFAKEVDELLAFPCALAL